MGRKIAAAAWLALLAFSVSGCCVFNREPVEANVANAREMSFRGLDAMQREDWKSAETLFARAVQACPEDERAQARYAELLWRRGAQAEAIRHMEQAVRLSGADPELLVQLGEMHRGAGNLAAAEEMVDGAIRGNRYLASAWALQGDILREQGNLTEALASYHRALSVQEHFPRVQLAIGELYGRQNRPERMLATLDSLLDQYPHSKIPADVLMRKGIALKRLGRFDEAVETLVSASQIGAPSADLLFHLSEARSLAGDANGALTTLAASLQRDPHHAASLRLRGKLESQQRDMTAFAPSATIR